MEGCLGVGVVDGGEGGGGKGKRRRRRKERRFRERSPTEGILSNGFLVCKHSASLSVTVQLQLFFVDAPTNMLQ